MTTHLMRKNISFKKQKRRCEICGNEVLPLQTLCKEHLEIRTAEQLKGREYISMIVRSQPSN